MILDDVKQRVIVRGKRGKKPAIRQARKHDPTPRHWNAGKMPRRNDPRDLDDERAWMDW